MSRPLPTPSTARFVLNSLTAAAMFYAPLSAYAATPAERAAVARELYHQGGAASTASGASATTSAGSLAGLMAAQARTQAAKTLAQRQSLQALQSTARAAAQAAASSVPNGLGAGGLLVAPGATVGSALWTGAQLPTQQVAGGLTTVTVDQNESQALLTWQNFNIGRETKLRFNQGGGDWIAFNQIVDPSANPTRILGSIEAPGQVYVINPNGVIFHGTAQVNTRTLVASSLPLNTNLVARGVLNNPATEFLFSGIQTNSFVPPVRDTAYGDVLVEAGAILNSPTNADKSGGRIALIGANVTQAGSISTPDGQTILAAGLQVGFEASTDASLRGLLVSVGQVDTYAGTATNSGIIDAARGAITVVGKAVNQSGLAAATTSVSRNGRIDLLAQYNAIGVGDYATLPDFFAQDTGVVTFGKESSTQVLPELTSTEKTVGTKLALKSELNVRGLAIHLDQNATLLAPSATVNLNAGRWDVVKVQKPYTANFIYTDGQVYLDSGARVDVSGTSGLVSSVVDNLIEVRLTGDELANSPLQRDGTLRGKTITVDILKTGTFNGVDWVGTPLADVRGYLNNIQRDIGQLTTAGGTVNINAGGSVVMRAGSAIDVSGGFVDYQGATVATTKVLYRGRVIDIASATPDLVYDGIFDGFSTPVTNVAKWGESAATSRQTYSPLLVERFQTGYVQGGNAGTLSVTAPTMALDNQFSGQSLSGIQQRTAPAASGKLALSFQGQYADAVAPEGYVFDSRSAPTVRFAAGEALSAPAAFALDGAGAPLDIDAERQDLVVLSPDLVQKSGFGRISVDNREGDVTVAPGSALDLPAGGELTLTGKNIDVGADLSAPGGQITLTATAVSQGVINDTIANSVSPFAGAGRGLLSVAKGASVSTAGRNENDATGTTSDAIITNGGTLTLTGYDVALAAGALLDVSGGVYISGDRKVSYGTGGTLTVLSGRDVNAPSVIGGSLVFDSTLSGYSGGKGGSLVLQAPAIQIGGGATLANATVFAPEFFEQGGFTSYDLRGIGGSMNYSSDQFTPGVLITAGTVLRPVADSYEVKADLNSAEKLTLTPVRYDVWQRSATSVSFSALGARDSFRVGGSLLVRGDLVMEAGAVIKTDPGAKITLAGETTQVLGSLTAQGGSITLKGGSNSNTLFPFTNADQPVGTLELGSQAQMDVSGTTVLRPDTTGNDYRTGKVYAGGSVSLAGNINAAAGSRIDVSGSTATLDLDPVYSEISAATVSRNRIATRVDSSAGTITLAGSQQLLTEATLIGAAGGPSAEGGKLVVSSGIYQPITGTGTSVQDVNLVVTQDLSTTPDVERGNLAVTTFNGGGFDFLTLGGTVQFSGPVSLFATRGINVATNGVIYGDDTVSLSAARVSLGTGLLNPALADADETRAFFDANNQKMSLAPVYGTGRLNVTASQLIDLGNLSLQGFGVADLQANTGSIRGSGTLDIAGDLSLRAGQVYPATGTILTLNAYDYSVGGSTQAGSIAVLPGAVTHTLPYSAGGTLNLNASTIRQDGVLRAPFGQINLGWNGTGTAPIDAITGLAVPVAKQVTLGAVSVTSVSGVDSNTGVALTLPYGAYVNGDSWVDPQGRDITNLGPEVKTVQVSGLVVTTEAGSLVDINGGGELVASRFKTGTGGKVDILSGTGSYAILPGYEGDYAPFGAFNDSVNGQTLLAGDLGYVNSTLTVGDRIYLSASPGLAAGFYTLLPARYAVLAGSFLVTPKTGAPYAETVVLPDNAAYVSGYRFNSTGSTGPVAAPLRSLYEVASFEVVSKRAEYETPTATAFFTENALSRGVSVPRLAGDAGILALIATQSMDLRGGITANAATGGLGGLVDISSPVDILIGGSGAPSEPGKLVLDASRMSAFSGTSLLIGGSRQQTAAGMQVTVSSNNVTVDNAGTPLAGAEIILTAKQNLVVADGAEIVQVGTLGGNTETLLFGDAAVAGSGDGALLRVSSDADASIARSGVSTNSTATLTVGANAQLSGGAALILDSTGTTQIDSSANFGAEAMSLNSGRISLQLTDPGALQAGAGLVLSGTAIERLQALSNELSLFSYSTIDVYGTGNVGSASFEKLTLGSPALRGFNNAGGTVTFMAKTIELSGGAGGTAPAVVAADEGTLVFAAQTLRIAAGNLALRQYAQVNLNASDRLVFAGEGALSASANLSVETPLVTAETASVQALTAGNTLSLAAPAGVAAFSGTTSGLGARVTLTGGTGVAIDTTVMLASGRLAVNATNGDVAIGDNALARVDVGGTAVALQNVVNYTNAGSLALTASAGDIRIGNFGTLNVAANSLGGDAGTLAVSAVAGEFTSTGLLLGQAGQGGVNGNFSADVGSLAGGNLATIDAVLNSGLFTQNRSHRVRSGDVEIAGLAMAENYAVSVDNGSLTVTGTIDASGASGGAINLAATGNLTLASGARLDASGDEFNSAGKGGSIKLGAGASRDGVANTTARLSLDAGATLDLSVASANGAADAIFGRTTGTLHLRAPRTGAGTDLALNPLNSSIAGASSVVLEGFKVHDLTPVSGTSVTVNSAVTAPVLADATTFGNATAAILARVTGSVDAAKLHVQPGIELVNRTGDLTMSGIWDLSTARYGPATTYAQREPGILTLRAAGNLNFPYVGSGSASLSDGFGTGSSALTTTTTLWNAGLLPVASRSWSYNLVAGADLFSASILAVKALDAALPSTGSLVIGAGAPAFALTLDTRQGATNGTTAVPQFYQVIRTGTGDIAIAARGDIELRNNLATIYTVGTQAASLADFDVPNTTYNSSATDLGARQYSGTSYTAHYSQSGGDISLFAQNDIFRTLAGSADSSKQMPSNWLSRRGNIDETTGEFLAYALASSTPSTTTAGPRNQRHSTSWWVDFNNFFEGVGALGGGNVRVAAGDDVANIDAVAPTNARMPAGKPDATKLRELGGGDVTVSAGGDIDGGVYYVERGRGTLAAGGDIKTNSTRTSLTSLLLSQNPTLGSTAEATWLPTTLFLGKGTFDLSAGGDLTLGNVANPFLLPAGMNNSYFLKSYFSTYSPDSGVTVSALTGDLTLRSRDSSGNGASLFAWYNNVLRRNSGEPTSTLAGRNQPWLRLYDNDLTAFATVSTLMPGRLDAFAATGDVNLIGSFNFMPSAQGGLNLVAADSINGLQVVGFNTSVQVKQWASAVVNYSDANPALLPSVDSPISISIASIANSQVVNTVTRKTADYSLVNALFAESGSYVGDVYGRTQTQQNLHAANSVRANAMEPVRLIAGSGDVSGLTLYSAQTTEVIAGRDISDVGLYLQNLHSDDVSVISAGRDILLFNPSSVLRTEAITGDNTLLGTTILYPGPGTGNATAGDLQIGGLGTLYVQAGRDMDLGSVPAVPPVDGTAVGLTSIGNARNLNLPDTGADVVIGVGVGDGSRIDRAAFDTAFLNPATAGANATRYLPALAALLGMTGADDATVFAAYSTFPSATRAQVTSAMFNQVLRDAGRDHNNPDAAGYGSYAAGFTAIEALFPGTDWLGDLRLSSRLLTTSAGGDITVFAPGGGINLGTDISKSQTPPGIITERGGSIALFTHKDVDIGTQRIFTLRGGDIMIWSSTGDIAAGSSSTTIQSASPTRVLIDPQTGDVKTDLAGLATGGGIGVLAAVEGVAAGDVDLIAPVGTIDAGDAGIRSLGNISIAALTVLNSANISAGGTTSGTPPAAAPAVAVATATASPDTGGSASAAEVAQASRGAAQVAKTPSFVNIEVIGYGGGDEEQEKDKTADGV